jgi:hypothetical protein
MCCAQMRKRLGTVGTMIEIRHGSSNQSARLIRVRGRLRFAMPKMVTVT